MEDFILYRSLILCSNHVSLETAPSYDKNRFARMQYRVVIINMDFSAINSAPRLHHKRNCEGWTLLSIKGHIIYCYTLYAYFNHPLTSLIEEVHSASNFLNHIFHNIKGKHHRVKVPLNGFHMSAYSLRIPSRN